MWSRWRLSPQSPPDPSERSSVSFQPVTCRAASFNLHDDPIAGCTRDHDYIRQEDNASRSKAGKGTVRLKFWAFFNRLMVAGNCRFSARFVGSLESHFQPNWR